MERLTPLLATLPLTITKEASKLKNSSCSSPSSRLSVPKFVVLGQHSNRHSSPRLQSEDQNYYHHCPSQLIQLDSDQSRTMPVQDTTAVPQPRFSVIAASSGLDFSEIQPLNNNNNKSINQIVGGDDDDYWEHEAANERHYRALVKKFDWRILPFVTLIYFLAFIARINISNIHDELIQDVGISEYQYSLLAMIFFVGYTIFEIPSNLGLKSFGARAWLGAMALIWGLLCVCCIFAHNFAVWIVLRSLLGSVEAGVFPGILYYLNFWYRRQEMGFRFSIFFTASLLAGGFVGLLAYVVIPLTDGWIGLAGWQWLLIVEGVPGMIVGIATWLYLPSNPRHASWLKEDDKRVIEEVHHGEEGDDLFSSNISTQNCDEDGYDDIPSYLGTSVNDQNTIAAPVDDKVKNSDHLESQKKPKLEKSSIRVFLRALRNSTLWIFSLTYLCIGIPVSAINFFLPSIIKMAGFQFSTANLITMPIYAAAALVTLCISFSSDRRGERCWHIIAPLSVSFIGFTGLALFNPGTGLLVVKDTAHAFSTGQNVLSLGFASLSVIGACPAIPLFCTWLSTIIPRSKPTLLAVGTGMMVSVGQLSGIIAPQLYPALDALYQKINGSQCDDENAQCMISSNYSYAHLAAAACLLVAMTGTYLLKRATRQ
ncbi:hypothetical protein MIR68_000400 [Amoeboaphelidium protococcarum]|nr:hypothetical protein MIR68_000400 [Amoeboaphelidium protococcarum]